MADVTIPIAQLALKGQLQLARKRKGLIIFVHGSGSSHLSPRNKKVASQLNKDGFATLLFDLLTPFEDQDIRKRFDIPLLTKRLLDVVNWVDRQPGLRDLPIGLFGASTGAAAALEAAATLKNKVKAVVCRGGRPDMAGYSLSKVQAAVLLIVGSLDYPIIDMNRAALMQLGGEKELMLIPGATHLFEEPGTLQQVISHSIDWFNQYVEKTYQWQDHLTNHVVDRR